MIVITAPTAVGHQVLENVLHGGLCGRRTRCFRAVGDDIAG